MTKIAATQPMSFSAEQKARLEKLGEVTYYDDVAGSPDEWVRRCKGFEVVCSGLTGLRDAYAELRDVLITVPFVGVSSFADPAVLKANNITLCNSPGANRHAVSEWIIFMVLESMRQFAHNINTLEPLTTPIPPRSPGLESKRIVILGKGSIGGRVGEVCKALDMKVSYYLRGDDLLSKVKDADIVVDVMSVNPSSTGLLNKQFFQSLKKGAVFISVTTDAIVDMDAMLTELDAGNLSMVAFDVMNARPGDVTNEVYRRLQKHPHVLATPDIASYSEVSSRIGNDMMIGNIEAWLAGHAQNVF